MNEINVDKNASTIVFCFCFNSSFSRRPLTLTVVIRIRFYARKAGRKIISLKHFAPKKKKKKSVKWRQTEFTRNNHGETKFVLK